MSFNVMIPKPLNPDRSLWHRRLDAIQGLSGFFNRVNYDIRISIVLQSCINCQGKIDDEVSIDCDFVLVVIFF